MPRALAPNLPRITQLGLRALVHGWQATDHMPSAHRGWGAALEQRVMAASDPPSENSVPGLRTPNVFLKHPGEEQEVEALGPLPHAISEWLHRA